MEAAIDRGDVDVEGACDVYWSPRRAEPIVERILKNTWTDLWSAHQARERKIAAEVQARLEKESAQRELERQRQRLRQHTTASRRPRRKPSSRSADDREYERD